MKRFALSFAITALLATFAIPSFAQDEKVKDKENKDRKKKLNRLLSPGKLIIKQKRLLRSMAIK